jgi:predicted nucleic acid-binding protein
VSYLVDTNVLSELRKGPRCHGRVASWFAGVPEESLHLSVLVVGEVRRGIERIRRRDARGAEALDRWLATIVTTYGDRILPVDIRIARTWGGLNVPHPLPTIDGLLAATALVHGLVLVTRNTKDVARTGAPFLDPFAPPRA